MSHIEFESLSRNVASLLTPLGFVQVRSELGGPFASHISEFANGANAYRIVWDGKESWLLGQYCDKYQESDRSSWSDVAIYRAGRYVSPKELATLGSQLIEALRVHLTSYAA
jgi:hypothetical protein